MGKTGTLLLQRNDVVMLLTIDECIAAVETAFSLHVDGKMSSSKVLGVHTDNGGFHIKAGIGGRGNSYFAAKINANFPNNSKYDLPSIQGVIAVFDSANGRLLAVMDSIEITIIRTGAATAIAAKHLALSNAEIVTICGCGNQGRISLKALMKVIKLEKVYAFDIDKEQREKFDGEFANEIEVVSIAGDGLSRALGFSHICVTCTPSKEPYIHARDIRPGTFIAAVGADSEEKQELFSDLIASNKIVADVAEQSARIGELHHAIAQGLINISGVHAELGQIITGKKPGRETDKEIIVFDSTGTALQDVVSAAIVYEKALANGIGVSLNFSE